MSVQFCIQRFFPEILDVQERWRFLAVPFLTDRSIKKTCFKTPEFPFMDGVTWSLRLLHNAVNFILLAILEPHAQDDMAGDVEVGRGVLNSRNLGLEWSPTHLQDCYAYLNRGPPLRN